jgi:non-ribosomal peptide synthetase component F
MLSPPETRQVLREWNDTATELPPHATLASLVEAQVERTPEAVAVVLGEVALSYRELNARANRLAHHLVELGVGPDVPVGVCLARSVDTVVAFLGILKAGGAYLPLDPAYPAERLADMLEQTQALGDELGLGPLAGAGRAEQDQVHAASRLLVGTLR